MEIGKQVALCILKATCYNPPHPPSPFKFLHPSSWGATVMLPNFGMEISTI